MQARPDDFAMEIPIQALSKPEIILMLLLRNLTAGLFHEDVKSPMDIDKEGLGDQVRKTIQALNAFFDVHAFNAKGLLKDGREPAEGAFKEWLNRSKIYFLMSDTKQGFDIKVHAVHQDPWDGIQTQEVYRFKGRIFVTFESEKEKATISLKFNDKDVDTVLEDNQKLISIKPTYLSSKDEGSKVPKIYTKAEIEKELNTFVDTVFNVNERLSAVAVLEDMQKALDNYYQWSGDSMLVTFSIYARSFYTSKTRKVTTICLSGRGNFELNAYFKSSIWVAPTN